MEAIQTETTFISEGVRAMFLSTLAFALANVFVKQLEHIPAMEIVFFRCAIAILFCFIGLKRANADWIGKNHKMLFLRGLFGTTALYFFFLTLQKIPLASAMTIQYLSPIFTAIIAIFVLKEAVKPMQWLFYAIAFAGVLFIGQFDFRVSYFYLFLGIISAFCSGVAYNLVRGLRGKEHPLTVVLHFQLVGIVVSFFYILFEWKTPAGWDWIYLIMVGVFAHLGQVFLTNALQKERAASVAIVNYSGLLYGLLFGWFVFGETQTLATVFGMILVVCGVILSIVYGRRQREVERIESTFG